jgi:hypothetical protein
MKRVVYGSKPGLPLPSIIILIILSDTIDDTGLASKRSTPKS